MSRSPSIAAQPRTPTASPARRLPAPGTAVLLLDRVGEGIEFGAQHVDRGVAHRLRLLAGFAQHQRHLVQHFGRALGAEHMNAPVERRCPHRRQRSGDAVDEIERAASTVSSGGGPASRELKLRIDLAHRPQHADEGIEHVQAGAGQPAARRFLRRQPPARGDCLASFRCCCGLRHEGCVPSSPLATMSRSARIDGQNRRLCPTASVTPASRQAREHARRVGAMQRQRLFAEHLLARGGAGDHLRRMQRMRRRQQHGLDGADPPGRRRDCRSGRDHVRRKNPARRPMSVSTARIMLSRSWPRAASTRLRPQRPRPTMAQLIIDASLPVAGRRTASITAALSLSGPSQRDGGAQQAGLRRRSSAATGRGVRLRRGSVRRPSMSAKYAIAAENPASAFFAPWCPSPANRPRTPAPRPGRRGRRGPRPSAKAMPSASAARLFCRIRLIASLVRLASPMFPTLARCRGQRISRSALAASMASGSPAISAMAEPSRTSALVPDIGASTSARPTSSAARSLLRVISPGAQVVVQIMTVCASLSLRSSSASSGFNLIGAVDGDDDGAAATPASSLTDIASSPPLALNAVQRLASMSKPITEMPGVDQPRRQRSAHQAEPDHSDRR